MESQASAVEVGQFLDYIKDLLQYSLRPIPHQEINPPDLEAAETEATRKPSSSSSEVKVSTNASEKKVVGAIKGERSSSSIASSKKESKERKESKESATEESCEEFAKKLKHLGDEHLHSDQNKSCEYHLLSGLKFLEFASTISSNSQRRSYYIQTGNFFQTCTKHYSNDDHKKALFYLFRAFVYSRCFNLSIEKLQESRSKILNDVRNGAVNRGDSLQRVDHFVREVGDVFGLFDCWKRARLSSEAIANSKIDIITISTEQLTTFIRNAIDQMKVPSDSKRKRSPHEDRESPPLKKTRSEPVRSERKEIPKNEDSDDSSDEKIVEETSETESSSPPRVQSARNVSTDSPESRWATQNRGSDSRNSKKPADTKPPSYQSSERSSNRHSSSYSRNRK